MFGFLPSVPLWIFVASAGISALFGSILCAQLYDLKLKLPEQILAISLPALLTLAMASQSVGLETVLWTVALIFCVTMLSIADASHRAVPLKWVAAMILTGLICNARIGADWYVSGLAIASIFSITWIIGARHLIKDQSSMRQVAPIAVALAWHGFAAIPDLAVLSGAALLLVRITSGLINPATPTCLPVPKPDTSLPLAPALGFAQLTIWLGGPIL